MRSILVTTVVLSGMAVVAAYAQVDAPMRGSRGTVLGIPPVEQNGDGATAPKEPPATGSTAQPAKRVKPPGSPLGEIDKSDKRAAAIEQRQRELDRRIRTGICRGC